MSNIKNARLMRKKLFELGDFKALIEIERKTAFFKLKLYKKAINCHPKFRTEATS